MAFRPVIPSIQSIREFRAELKSAAGYSITGKPTERFTLEPELVPDIPDIPDVDHYLLIKRLYYAI
jgi:hypothetical protein